MSSSSSSSSTKRQLAAFAADTIVQNGMLIRVTVAAVENTDDAPSSDTITTCTTKREHSIAKAKEEEEGEFTTGLLSPDTTVSQLKTIIYGRLNIPESQQRLCLSRSNEPILYGPLSRIVSPSTGGELTIHVARVVLDPRLESLYDMVWLGDWKERDEITARMMRSRLPRHCDQGHELTTTLAFNDDERLQYRCAICHCRFKYERSRRFGSGESIDILANICRNKDCAFCLCSVCLREDNGHSIGLLSSSSCVPDEGDDHRESAATTDPYQSLQDLAVGVGRDMASVGAWFGDRGHMCGYPEVRCKSEFAPKALQTEYSSFEDVKKVNQSTKIFHDGIKLTVRFNEEARIVLESAGLQREMNETEFSKVFERGATTQDVIDVRNSWHKSPHFNQVWTALNEEWKSRFPGYTNFGQPAESFTGLRCVAYGLDEVVYEIHVYITDGDY